jgi:hypothetical protein
MKTLLVLALNLCCVAAWSQSPAFTVTVSNDSVLLGNVTVVRFDLENINGSDFHFPDFAGFQVNGPSVSTQMNIVNGQVNQRTSYTYYLEPLDIGEYYIEPASVETEAGFLETEPVPIQVYPNPDNIIQPPSPSSRQPFLNFGNPWMDGDTDGRSPFGRDPFGNDFFNDRFFEDFFQGMPGLQMPALPPRDSLLQHPKKRKTTRI